MIAEKKILLVDDIVEYLNTMELNLPDGCQAFRATSLEESRNLISKEQPAVAIVDIRLDETDFKNRDGLELLKWVNKNYPRTTVIMISAYREFEFEAESLALGAENFLKKPIQPDEFRKAVAQVLEQNP